MANKANKLSIFCWIILQALALLGCSGSLVARENVTVNFGKVVQEDFLGVNAVYHGFTYLPESIEKGMAEEFRAIEMDRVEQVGLQIARTFFRPDWSMGKDAWTKPDWNSAKMQALYNWLADMQERNVDVGLNMGWWFARDVIWKHDQHLASYPDDIKNYTKWVSDALGEIIHKRGFKNVKYIFMFTEPGNNFGDIPHGKKSWQYYEEVLREVHKQLLKDGRRDLVKMVGPNSTQAPRWVQKAANSLDGVIDIYSSHNYNFTTYDDWYKMAMQVKQASSLTGKPFWIDEYGVQDFELRKSFAYGNILAQANAAFMNAGAQTSLLWILNDQYYPYPIQAITNGDAFVNGLHQWGLYPWLPSDKGSVRPAWQVFTLMSKLFGGENVRVYECEGSETVKLAAVKNRTDGVSVMIVNTGGEENDVQIRFSESIGQQMYRYAYEKNNEELYKSADRKIEPDTNFSHVTYYINDTLSKYGVNFYTTNGINQSSNK